MFVLCKALAIFGVYDIVIALFCIILQQKDALDTSTTALVSLLNAQPSLADAVPVVSYRLQNKENLNDAEPYI